MKKVETKKLRLETETLRLLERDEMKKVAGGASVPSMDIIWGCM